MLLMTCICLRLDRRLGTLIVLIVQFEEIRELSEALVRCLRSSIISGSIALTGIFHGEEVTVGNILNGHAMLVQP